MTTAASDTKVRTNRRRAIFLLWTLPIAFIIHDAEEAIYLAREGQGVVAMFTGIQTTVAETIAAILVELVLFAAITWWATLRIERNALGMRAYAVLMVMWALHGVLHLGQAIAAGSYTMGSITAAPFCLIYGAAVVVWMWRQKLVGARLLMLSPVIGVVAFYPLLGVSHNIGVLIA